jgi:hypothetical protein
MNSSPTGKLSAHNEERVTLRRTRNETKNHKTIEPFQSYSPKFTKARENCMTEHLKSTPPATGSSEQERQFGSVNTGHYATSCEVQPTPIHTQRNSGLGVHPEMMEIRFG